MVNQLEQNLRIVRRDIENACLSSGRDPSEVLLVAVSKTFPSGIVQEVADCGQIDFGENRIQEARDKIPLVDRSDLRWHLIGHLQSNKVRQAVELFDVIQTVDSSRLAHRLNRVCKELGKMMPVLIEVNIAEERQKAGLPPEEVASVLGELEEMTNLDPRGLMAIPPFSQDPEATRPYFRRLASLRDQLNRERAKPLVELSMGMSADYRAAIEEGATIIRVGTAIFGERT